jgi:hypothetical protein
VARNGVIIDEVQVGSRQGSIPAATVLIGALFAMLSVMVRLLPWNDPEPEEACAFVPWARATVRHHRTAGASTAVRLRGRP